MRTINVNVNGMFIQKDNKNGGVKGEANATQLHIVFDETWSGYGKRVIWRDAYGENPVAVDLTPSVEGLINGDLLTFDTPIPGEPLAHPGWCTFTLDGYQAGDPSAIALTVSDSLRVYPNDTDYQPAEPTPSQAQQIMDAIEQIVPDMQEIATEAKSWAVGGTGSREGEDTNNAKYYCEQAEDFANYAEGDADDAAQSAVAASGSASAAAASATESAGYAGSASQSASAASGSATAAAGSAASAHSAQLSAETAQGKAEDAQEAAEAAQSAAETARTGAETAETNAEAAQAAAESAKTAAESAKSAAESARGAAESAAEEAEEKSGEAAQSAGDAAQSASDAAGKATLSESWAVGGTGTREGEDTNNARYWSTVAQGAAGGGVTSFNGRSGAVIPQTGDYTADMVGARPNTWTPSAEDVGARPDTWIPSAADVGAIPDTQKGQSGGVASLDSSGKVPSSQLPAMDYIPTSQKGAAGGVATLGTDGKVPAVQLPEMDFYTKAQIFATATKTKYGLGSSAVPDDAFEKLADGVAMVEKAIRLPEGGEWNSVAYGDGCFVAVNGQTGNGAYSDDGITWHSVTLPNPGDGTVIEWTSVAYGDGKFVAVANGAALGIYSTDKGESWNTFTLPSAAKWTSVTYGNGRFVAVSQSTTAAYSTNGTTWTRSTLPSNSLWNAVAYGGGKFVAVLQGGNNVAYSTDGSSWSSATLSSNYSMKSVTYGNGKFVATGGGANALYSSDGTSWTATTMPNGNVLHNFYVTYGNGKFVAVSSRGDNAYSEDGNTWTATAVPGSITWNSVAYGGGKFVAVPNLSTSVTISADGINWSNTADILVDVQGNNITDTVASALGLSSYAKIATGSYVGTGTYGSSNPNTLTFEFEPKFLVVQTDTISFPGGLIWVNGISEIGSIFTDTSTSASLDISINKSGKSITWYSSDGSEDQMNSSSQNYYYFAIG